MQNRWSLVSTLFAVSKVALAGIKLEETNLGRHIEREDDRYTERTVWRVAFGSKTHNIPTDLRSTWMRIWKASSGESQL